MADFYGSVIGRTGIESGKCGGKNIRVAARSWDGSVITELKYDDKLNNLAVRIELSTDSATSGKCFFYGTLDELACRLAGNGIIYHLEDLIDGTEECWDKYE